MDYTTADYLESLQDDLDRTIVSLELEEGTNFTDIADMAENGDISTGGGGDLSEYFVTEITSNVTNYSKRKNVVKKAPAVNITDNVTTLRGGFYGATIDNVVLTGGNNLTNIRELFAYSYVKNVDLSNMNFSNVTNMSYLFNGSPILTNVNFGNIDTSQVTDMTSAFTGCTNLVDLDLSKFTTTSVTKFTDMFNNCQNLNTLDIRNFTFDSNPSYAGMFSNIRNQCTIIVKSDTEKQWILDKFPSLTGVKTVAEYEAQ